MSRKRPYPSDPSFSAPTGQVDEPALARTAANLGVVVDELTDEQRRRLGESAPVTPPTSAPGGAPSPNSVRAREEGLGVKPSVVEGNLVALDEWAQAEASQRKEGTGGSDTPAAPAAKKAAGSPKEPTDRPSHKAKPSTLSPAEQAKRDARNARRREQRAAKKAAEGKK